MPASKKKILVVDDEPSVSDAIKMMLLCQGHDVQTAHSGREALAILDAEKFDIVTTDYEMEGMLGDELAAAIKARSPGMPILMISGQAQMLQFSNHPLTDLDCVLGKPFSYQDLCDAIDHLSHSADGVEPT